MFVYLGCNSFSDCVNKGMFTMVMVHKERFGMMVMCFTCHYIDMKEVHSTPTAISDLSTWSVMVKVSASK